MVRPGGGEQHPEEWRDDLSPNAGAGANVGPPRWESEGYRTAFEEKDVHLRLRDFHDDDLKRMPIVPAGERLEQGASYLDLRADAPVEFTATAQEVAGDREAFVPKSEVDYELWNRLLDALGAHRERGAA